MPFCGHATIATAVALAEAEGVGPFMFETAAGVVETSTERDAEGRVTAGFRSVEPHLEALDPGVADRLLGILGLRSDDLDERMPLAQAFAGNLHPVVAIASRETFDAFTFDPAVLRTLMDERGWKGTVITVHIGGDLFDGLVAEARNLFPVGEITEDPATGSAAASLGAYLRERGALAAPFAFTVLQGRHIGRPSVLEVEVPASGGILVREPRCPCDAWFGAHSVVRGASRPPRTPRATCTSHEGRAFLLLVISSRGGFLRSGRESSAPERPNMHQPVPTTSDRQREPAHFPPASRHTRSRENGSS